MSALPTSARHWLFGVETCFVVLAVILAVLFLDRVTPSAATSSGPSVSQEENFLLNEWPGKRHGYSFREGTRMFQRHCLVLLAAFLAVLLLDRVTPTATTSSGPSVSQEENFLLNEWPGKRQGFLKDTVVTQLSARRLTKATGRMMCDPHVQLLAPLVFYTGLSLGFVLNDFTVSYVNCALGLHQIGYVIVAYGTVSAAASLLVGHVTAAHIRRVYVVISGATFNAGLLLALAWWSPDPDDPAMFYVVSGCLGLCDAIWQTQTNTLFGILFVDDQEAAFSCYRTFQTLGLVAAYVSSTGQYRSSSTGSGRGLRWPPCLPTKLYIMSVLLAVSLVLYAAAEYTLPRRSRLVERCHTALRASPSVRVHQRRSTASDFHPVVL